MLTDEELETYQELSAKIAKLAGRDDEQAQESLKLLLMRRAELLNKAANKIVELSKLIEASDHIEHTLFYCAPGQIDDVQRLLVRLGSWVAGAAFHGGRRYPRTAAASC